MTENPAARSSSRYPRVMKLLRRIHLYSGLLLAPWVLLYGVTAFLFNHPGAFNDQAATPLEPALVEDLMAPIPRPEALAQELIDRINRGEKDQPGAAGDQLYRLLDAESARYRGDLFVVARDGERERSLRALPDGRGFARERPAKSKKQAPFARRRLVLEDLDKRLKGQAQTVFAALGSEGVKPQLRRAPRLEFRLTDGEKRWQARYRIDKKDLVAELIPTEDEPFRLRRFLLRLHLSHTYPQAMNARWLWALVVDFMAAGMVFWALSGLLMWLQMKKVRLWGLVFVGGSTLLAIASFWGMMAFLT